MVSAAVAGLTGTMAVVLLIWAARTVNAAQVDLGASRTLERVYEQARLLDAADLQSPAQGQLGPYRWSRNAEGRLDPQLDYGPVRVNLQVVWATSAGSGRKRLEAVIEPGGAPRVQTPPTPSGPVPPK